MSHIVSSLQVLGIQPGADDNMISAAYQVWVSRFHPDNVKDAARKEESEEIFMRVQAAYEAILNIKARRAQRNKKQPSKSKVKTGL